MDHSLESQIRRYYEGKALSPDRVAAISASSSEVRGQVRDRRWFITLAAAFAMLFVLAAFFLARGPDLNSLVASEVASNHLKQLESEVQTGAYAAIRERLSKITFPLAPSAEVDALQALVLRGGRYCSVQGELAAQLKFTSGEDDSECTLYIVPDRRGFRQLREGTHTVNGVKVRIWRDTGRIFALASNE